MSEPVKRRYDSSRRALQAGATRAAILAAARDHFVERGYARTAVADIAAAAQVSVDTVYTSVGRKPQLMLAVIDMTLASSDHPVAVEQREYVRAIHDAAGARAKLDTYATALGRVMPKVAPLFEALGQAALTDDECARLKSAIADRRAVNMRTLAAELRATGDLRTDVTDQHVADLLWTTNAPEYFALAMARGWSTATYAARLADLWRKVLLAES